MQQMVNLTQNNRVEDHSHKVHTTEPPCTPFFIFMVFLYNKVF